MARSFQPPPALKPKRYTSLVAGLIAAALMIGCNEILGIDAAVRGQCQDGDCGPMALVCPARVLGDGTCNGPSGKSKPLCASDRSDSEDCCSLVIASLGSGFECDPVSQCGCPEGQACYQFRSEDETTARCMKSSEQGGYCSRAEDCKKGFGCSDGLCLAYCDLEEPATCEGACFSAIDASVIGFCRASCKYGMDDCPEGQQCTRYRICYPAFDAELCSKAQGDGVCDGPNGTRLCAKDEDDAEDCCEFLRQRRGEDFSCDPLTQCGCAEDTACYVGNGARVNYAQCLVRGTGEVNAPCDEHTDCAKGTACIDNICATICRNALDERCDGYCVALGSDLGVCMSRCDFPNNTGCPEGLTCACLPGGTCDGNNTGRCIRPWTDCYVYDHNGFCDGPEGSRYCEHDGECEASSEP